MRRPKKSHVTEQAPEDVPEHEHYQSAVLQPTAPLGSWGIVDLRGLRRFPHRDSFPRAKHLISCFLRDEICYLDLRIALFWLGFGLTEPPTPSQPSLNLVPLCKDLDVYTDTAVDLGYDPAASVHGHPVPLLVEDIFKPEPMGVCSGQSSSSTSSSSSGSSVLAAAAPVASTASQMGAGAVALSEERSSTKGVHSLPPQEVWSRPLGTPQQAPAAAASTLVEVLPLQQVAATAHYDVGRSGVRQGNAGPACWSRPSTSSDGTTMPSLYTAWPHHLEEIQEAEDSEVQIVFDGAFEKGAGTPPSRGDPHGTSSSLFGLWTLGDDDVTEGRNADTAEAVNEELASQVLSCKVKLLHAGGWSSSSSEGNHTPPAPPGASSSTGGTAAANGDPEESSSGGLGADHVEQFTVSFVSDLQMHEDLEEISCLCTFCLDDMKIGDELCRLPCMHTFHRRCVHAWLARDRRCMLCRLDVTRPRG
eukprot:TRINITY_DN62272_c0_g1_i1.p1 TRINITY_DN62272_c0_g1~~TRINITY_DN62272_c0_g1_i1.p1  ORF type:complete len:475 (-),score=74.31 TRINITY_DN62272_c0_g1_i1:139-1563(-)